MIGTENRLSISDSNKTKYEIEILWIQNSKIDFLKTKSEICDFQIQKPIWKFRIDDGNDDSPKFENQKIKIGNQFSKFYFLKTKPETEIQNLKILWNRKSIFECWFQTQNSKIDFRNPIRKTEIRNLNVLNPEFESPFSTKTNPTSEISKTQKLIWKIRINIGNDDLPKFQNPKSMFEIRFKKKKRNLNFGNPEFEKRFSKNELRNLRFPKFKNRFEKSESIIVELMAIYKKPWNQKNETCFKKV